VAQKKYGIVDVTIKNDENSENKIILRIKSKCARSNLKPPLYKATSSIHESSQLRVEDFQHCQLHLDAVILWHSMVNFYFYVIGEDDSEREMT
jgi:hypothetical protein